MSDLIFASPNGSFRRSVRLFAFVAAFFMVLSQNPVIAQDEVEEEPAPELMEQPIATIAVASVERLKTDIKHVFDVSGRTEIYEMMEEGLANVGDLKGMDQTKPFGVMVFLRAGFPPTPEVVGFVPVEKIEDLTKTLEIGPVVTKKVSDSHYEIIGANREFHVKLQDGFAFIMNQPELMENDFPNPARSTKGITSKFDIAATLNLDSIPSGMRNLFMNFVKAQANADMQQRDDEPDGAYKIRRAQSSRMLDGLTQTMAELERLTIGIDANAEKSQLVLEVLLDAQEDSAMAKEMKRINGKRSHFDRLVSEEAPFSLSWSAPLEKRDIEQWTEMLAGGELLLAAELNKETDETELPPAVADMMQAIRDTVEDGHGNLFAQFYGEPGRFHIVGAVRVMGGRRMDAGFKYLLNLLKDDLDVEIGTVELDALKHNDVSFHRFVAKDADDAAAVFGEQIGVYLGAGNRTVWFAVGGEAAIDKTKELMDILNEPQPANQARIRRAPFEMVFNFKQWLGLDEDGKGMLFDAFEEGGDRALIDIRPSEDGMRIRATVDEGYLRLIGMGIGRRFDRREERRANRERGRRDRPGGSNQ